MHALWAPVSPGRIKLFMFMDIYMFGRVCKDGMKTLHSKAWTQLHLFDVATRLLPAGMLLLLGVYLSLNRVLFSFVVSGKTKIHPTCVYSKSSE